MNAPDWPANAVPEAWIESLFSRMAALYGSRFADMWRGVDIGDVRKAWGVELKKLSPEQLRAGVASLVDSLPHPPTLPQFVAHCRAARRESTGHASQLTDQSRANPEQQAANMQRLKTTVRPLNAPRSGIAWAWRLLERGKSASGGALPSEVVRCAEDAIKNYAARGKGESNGD